MSTFGKKNSYYSVSWWSRRLHSEAPHYEGQILWVSQNWNYWHLIIVSMHHEEFYYCDNKVKDFSMLNQLKVIQNDMYMYVKVSIYILLNLGMFSGEHYPSFRLN